MPNEFKHKDPGASLTQAEYITTDGTGHIFDCQATGDILYASSATVLKNLDKGAAGAILNMGGSCIPAWNASPSFTALTLSGTLDVNGTIDYDGTDVDMLSSGDIDLVSSANAAAAIYIAQSTGTSGTVKIHADTGTSVTEGAESINILSDVGGVGIRSTANLANAINLTVDSGTTSSMTLFNDTGTTATEGASSIQLTSDVGAIGILSGLNAAGAIRLTADAGTSETIILHADQGNGVGSICLTSDAGGITLNPGTFVTIGGIADGEIRLMEDSGAGTNYVAIKAQDMSASYTLTLPADDGCACEVLKTNGSGVLDWTAAGGGPAVLKKDADFSKACNTTFGNDDDFLLAVLANETWRIEYHLKLSGVNTGGLKWQFVVPSGSISWYYTAWTASQTVGSSYGANAMTTGDANIATGAAAKSLAGAIIYGRAVIGSCGGCIIPQWAQESSDSTNTTIEAESYQIAWKE